MLLGTTRGAYHLYETYLYMPPSDIPGIIVGTNAVVAAGALLTKNIPANEVWMGNPAKFHMKRQAYEEARA